jgi:hypothetical protein
MMIIDQILGSYPSIIQQGGPDMIAIRRGRDRGETRLDWLDSRHSFAFGEYRDPRHPGFRALRVLNEDRVAPGSGFGEHGHRDAEILTVPLAGAIEHRDSVGNRAVIRAGDVQRMTAGRGVLHSEWNPGDEEAWFLQVWLRPEREGLQPGYEERRFPFTEAISGLWLLASRDGREGSLTVHADADVWLARLRTGETREVKLRPGRHAWLQVTRGSVGLRGKEDVRLEAGDGAAASELDVLALRGQDAAELLIFDLA